MSRKVWRDFGVKTLHVLNIALTSRICRMLIKKKVYNVTKISLRNFCLKNIIFGSGRYAPLKVARTKSRASHANFRATLM